MDQWSKKHATNYLILGQTLLLQKAVDYPKGSADSNKDDKCTVSPVSLSFVYTVKSLI